MKKMNEFCKKYSHALSVMFITVVVIPAVFCIMSMKRMIDTQTELNVNSPLSAKILDKKSKILEFESKITILEMEIKELELRTNVRK